MPAERQCQWCNNPVPPGRRKFCSTECVHAYHHEQAEMNDYLGRSPGERFNDEYFAHKRVILLHDPTGDFRPGSVFGSDDVVTHGRVFEQRGKWKVPARECWTPGTVFEVRPKGKEAKVYRVNDERMMERVANDQINR